MNKNFIAAAILAVTSIAAQAADAGFYIGADVGRTKVDDFGKETSVGGFAGYQFNQNVAVEVGYRDLGTFKIMGFDAKTKQAAVSVIGSVPFGNGFSAFGRLGYNNLKVDVRGYSADDNGTLAGIGLGYAFNANVSARLEFQRVANDTKNLSVGVAYKF